MKNYGLTFNGVEIKNKWDLQGENYSVLDVNEPATPRLNYTEFIIPRRNGVKRVADRYENKQIEVVIEVRGQDPTANMRALLENWVGIESKLIFSKSPHLFYYAEIFEEIGKEEMSDGTFQLTVLFEASPFMYELYTDAREIITNDTYNLITNDADGILTNTAIWQDITGITFKQLLNNGNHDTMPIIAISGTATKVTCIMDDVEFAYNNLNNETVFIDSEKMICYVVAGNKKVSKLPNFFGIFPAIKKGINEVTISGTKMNVEIEVKYRTTYIV